LPSAIDNRPLNFNEFLEKLKYVIFTSATPGQYELGLVNNKPVQQIIRPTGLLDPTITIKPALYQIDDIVTQIIKCQEQNERVFILTLTIKMAEDLTNYLQERKIKAAYLHNHLKTLERTKILIDLRKGVYDVIVGINLLREGLDVPEVALICILDADKPGFLRDTRSLIQIIGRAARNKNGRVILYANKVTLEMEKAIAETDRRRQVQMAYNQKHGITPRTIIKAITEVTSFEQTTFTFPQITSAAQKQRLIIKLKREMQQASQN
jgi:excinuclease ABC subunit B